MGLFGRKHKDDGFIDMGDGQVAISPERQRELVDHCGKRAIDFCDEGLSEGVWEILDEAVRRRHGVDPGDALQSLLRGLAHMGYCSRRVEDEMETEEAAVPWLTREIQLRAESAPDEAPDFVEIFASIALELCDTSRDDPSAPRSVDAIPFGGQALRDQVQEVFVIGAQDLAAQDGLCQQGELPPGVDDDEMRSVWRIGFIVRALEQSVPSNWTDPDVTLIVVDSEAAREAVSAWAEANPDCTQEESDAAVKAIMLDPKFRIDVDDERVGVDPRFVMFELDADGDIIPQDREAPGP